MLLAPMLRPLFPLLVVTESELLKELLKLDPQKTSGSDGLDPFIFMVAVPIVASNPFNMSLLSEDVPIAWKAATPCPLFKGGDQANVIGLFLFCPVYQKYWKNLTIIN
jgi:hypothetical protein